MPLSSSRATAMGVGQGNSGEAGVEARRGDLEGQHDNLGGTRANVEVIR